MKLKSVILKTTVNYDFTTMFGDKVKKGETWETKTWVVGGDK